VYRKASKPFFVMCIRGTPSIPARQFRKVIWNSYLRLRQPGLSLVTSLEHSPSELMKQSEDIQNLSARLVKIKDDEE